MGCLSIKTVCKGTALLIFVLLLGLNAQTSVTDVLAASDTTSSSLTESQTSVPTTAPATTSSPSAESQTSAPSTSTTTSSPSTETSAPSRPNAIENLTVTEISTSFVLLKWEKQLKMGSSFKVQWTADETYGNVTVTVTNVTINGLTAGVNYKFCVTVVAADTSTESNSVCISAWTKPDVIRDLRVTNITTSSVFLRWNEPGGKRDFFKIQWTDDKTNKTTTNTSYNITDLTAGVNYTFCITAVAANQSTEGEPVCISNYTKPDVIRNLTVNNITTSSVFLTWNEPGGKRDFFKIQWTDDKTNRNSTTNTFYNITDLTAGVSYKFCITAVAADQSTEGEPVCISNYTKPDVIRNLTVNNITTSSVFLTWNEPGGKRDFFKIQWTDDKTNRNSTTNTFYNITDLTAGVSYKFCITAVAADQSTEGETVCISNYTKPDVIRNLRVTNITTSSVFLTWTEPDGNRSFFKLQRTDDKTNKTTTNTSYNITDLTAGVNYTFCITAVAADQSTEGETVCISQFTKPDVIRNLRVTNITTSSVFLRWNEPAGKRNFFKIQWTDDKTNRNSTTNAFYNITDLTAGVNYTFCITAVASDESTEGEPVCISNYIKPDVIRNLTVTDVTASSVLLTWDEPGGKRDCFRIQWTDEKRTNNKETKTINNTSYHITDLTAGVNYTFCITAVASDKSTEGEPVCISHCTISPNKDSEIPVTVGVVLAVICFLIIMTLILFFYSRRQTKNNVPTSLYTPLAIKCNDIALRIEDYEEYFKQKHADSNCGFAVEYEELKTVGTAQSKNTALAIENKPKNRYSNVLPYDASRVKLSMCGSPFDDYINANYIPGYNSRKEFIAAQGPLPVTVNEFWRMIWEKNIYTIVMLTKCNEMGRVKCEKYWPSGTNHYQNNSVTTTSEIELESWTIRDFRIKNVKTAETRYVRQFHFTAWPDHGVPQTTEVLIDFRHLVREHMDQYSRHSPTVVHCSAGVGRTGTFIAIDHLIFQIERDSMVDIYGIVNDMRMHRPLMGLNAQTHTGITSLPVTLSISSNESLTSPQTLPTTAPATTSSPSTESQTSTPTTAPATTSSPSTESQTSAPTTVPATTSSLSTEFQTSAPTTASLLDDPGDIASTGESEEAQ
ncbi:hypothetical protein G5714_024411 [Onychostoma macrolepis]|uniref:protein-tyrosine-phosphatase n=1 Tax=Onychostoma macrolepis TaxID=369639 RepID=A0A7J6BLW9_9TELE|nr:hypothetical protein G5714_024411 [Onychostoma macrolepis]